MNTEVACKEFTSHPVRKVCRKCRKSKEDHPMSEEDAEGVRNILKVFTEQAEIKPNAQYAWTPPQCPGNRLDEYFKKFPESKVPRHKSEGQKNRLKRLTFQVPLSDVSLDNCRFVDPESKTDLENFIQKLQNSILRLGIVKQEWVEGMPIQCPKCLLILEPRELVVVSAESDSPAFHPECFVCFQCGDALADLIHCCDVDGTVFCVRHYCDSSKKRCHSCDELIFSSHYALAGEKFYHRDHLLCFNCDSLLQSSKGYEKGGELYCGPCYQEKFCQDCHKCGKKISLDSRHVTYRDDNWHYDCFTCNKCEVLLSDSPFEIVEDKFFCNDCYEKEFAPKCEGCNTAFDPHAKVVKYEGKIFHVPCFKCMDCEESIGTGSFVPHKDRVYCKGCHLRNFGVRCFRCKYTITDEKGIMYNKEPYHENCFICTGCSTGLATRPFKTVSDQWYCMSCYADTFCKKCHYCLEPIMLGANEDILYSFEDYRWHAGCFTCSVCKKSLADSPFAMQEKVLVCSACLQQTDEKPNIEKTEEETKTTEQEENDQPGTVMS